MHTYVCVCVWLLWPIYRCICQLAVKFVRSLWSWRIFDTLRGILSIFACFGFGFRRLFFCACCIFLFLIFRYLFYACCVCVCVWEAAAYVTHFSFRCGLLLFSLRGKAIFLTFRRISQPAAAAAAPQPHHSRSRSRNRSRRCKCRALNA